MFIMIILNVIFIGAILYCFSTINEMIHDIKGIEDKNKMIKGAFEYAEKHLDNKKCQYIHYEKTSCKWLELNLEKKS